MQTLQTSTPARLCYLHLASKAPQQQVDFYRRLLDMNCLAQADGSWLLQGPQRAMLISPADHSGLLAAAYDLGSQARLSELRTRLVSKGCSVEALDSPLLEAGAFQIRDPQGRQTVFGVSLGAVATDRKGMPGRLQHVVFQTTELEAMIDFYVNTVGFTVSDNVVDEQSSQLTTCFCVQTTSTTRWRFSAVRKTNGIITVTKPTSGMTFATGATVSPRSGLHCSLAQVATVRAITCSSWWSMPIAIAWSSRRSWKSPKPAARQASGPKRNTPSTPGDAPGYAAEKTHFKGSALTYPQSTRLPA